MRSSKPLILIVVGFISLFLASCQSKFPAPKETSKAPTSAAVTSTPAASTVPQIAATATTPATRTLVICTSDEPQSLYVYGGSSRSMWTVLEAVYDGPFDTRGFSTQPVIIQKIPSFADGDAAVKPITVKAGDSVVDIDGNLVALKAGTKVLPSGCSKSDCAVAWDGQSELAMDQLSVTFKLIPGVRWSDGQPLTSADSVFSYTLASDPATPSSKYLTDRTVSYKAADDQTVEWTGLPGFFEQRYGTFFWLPLPKHAWGSKSASALLTDSAATRSPLGWGPYVIKEWAAGDHITLTKNPAYFRAGEGLPKFDTLVYRFVGEAADGAMNALLSGECDAVDQNSGFLAMVPGLLERQRSGKLQLYQGQGPEWEHLDFGIRPSSYDDGYNPAAGDRPDLFGDVRTRQAFAYCTDRTKIISDALYSRSIVPNSFLPPSHPLYQKDIVPYPYDPAQGAALLDAVGWKDTDSNPATPRVATGVQGVPDGTPLSVSYFTTQAALRLQVAQTVSDSLSQCGIQVSVKQTNPADLFGPGPNGLIFGRKFDLVQFSWEASARPNCQLYSTAQIPDGTNHWIGVNVSGYSSTAYDNSCASAYWARPTDSDYAARDRAVQDLYKQDVPSIPLYFYPKIAISRPDLCGLDMDVTARSMFWNLESLDYGKNCPKP